MAPLRLVTAALMVRAASAILVTEGSPCATSCGNNLGSTAEDEVVCSNADLESSGTVFKNCLNCEIASDYNSSDASPVTSDLQSVLYNLRATLNKCLYESTANPCLTSRACEPLKDAIGFDNLAPNATAFGYCSIWSEEFESACGECLVELPDGMVLNNYFTILNGACDLISQSPSTIPIKGDPFSATQAINITDPTPTATVAPPPTVGPLQYGQLAGVVVGAIVVLLIIAGCGVVCNGKRRRKRYLRRRSQQLQGKTWPSSPMRHEPPGSDLFATPVSQRPLRGHGWADSPISAATSDGNFPRYFSPYSSTYNSPVSAAGTPHNMPWPTLDGAQPNIGVALSSETPPSRDYSGGDHHEGQHRARDTYEMQGLGSEGRSQHPDAPPPALQSSAPILSHPGYGRGGSSSSKDSR